MTKLLPPFDIYLGDGRVRPEVASALPAASPMYEERGNYVADEALCEAVNLALCVSQPLLLTGEAGCGKTRLAWSVARELGLGQPLVFNTRSNSRAQDLLYTYDAVERFHDIQAGNRERAANPRNYIRYEALGLAILDTHRRVVLLDEIDKAPRDFPNDLLHELDRMEFEVREVDGIERKKSASMRPIVIITSNVERQLPLPFLRRCVFHHIEFPSRDKLTRIIQERLGHLELDGRLIEAAVEQFFRVRDLRGLTKKPATGELLTWMMALHQRRQTAEALAVPLPRLPLWQALLKDRDDYERLRAAQ